jgi:hypothetical protein
LNSTTEPVNNAISTHTRLFVFFCLYRNMCRNIGSIYHFFNTSILLESQNLFIH